MAKTFTIVALTLGTAAVAVAGGAWGAIYYGAYNVAAIVPDPWPVAAVLHYASDHAVAARLGDIKVPDGFDKPSSIEAGAVLFGKTCVICHGGPGLTPTRIAQGLNPSPPDLFRSERDAEADETFWFIKNGVKMTGMPGFGRTLSDAEIWSLTAFLSKAPGMSAAEFGKLTGSATLTNATNN